MSVITAKELGYPDAERYFYEAQALGVRIAHLQRPENKGGCTVAYRPQLGPGTRGRMLEVAVSYTHPNEQYVKKVGAQIASWRFLVGETICVPINARTPSQTIQNLWHMFYFSTGDWAK